MDMIAVILAGGGGTRFWPLSRQNKPKQFLNLSGNDIMINDTILRYESVIPIRNTIIVTNRSQADMLEQVLLSQVPRENILKEPEARNTSACILYAAFHVRKKYGDAVMAVMPSDHYFTDIESFRNSLKDACRIAETTDKLVTIGIKPLFPATGYGYIKFSRQSIPGFSGEVYEVSEFVEKPTLEKARKYLESGDYLWNSGMFIWKTSVIINSFERYLPRLYKSMLSLYEYIGTELEQEYLAKIYPSLQSISVDFGILERSDDVVVIPGDFGWNDVGSWDSLGAIFPTDKAGNIVKAKHIGINTSNSIIYGNERLISTIDLDGLIIADTDDALLICPKSKAQEVKKLVELMKEKGYGKFV